mgnify:CR=1 FL=1
MLYIAQSKDRWLREGVLNPLIEVVFVIYFKNTDSCVGKCLPRSDCPKESFVEAGIVLSAPSYGRGTLFSAKQRFDTFKRILIAQSKE